MTEDRPNQLSWKDKNPSDYSFHRIDVDQFLPKTDYIVPGSAGYDYRKVEDKFEEAVNNAIEARKNLDSAFRSLRASLVRETPGDLFERIQASIRCIAPEDIFVKCSECGGICYPEPGALEYGQENIFYCSQCGNEEA